MLTAVHAVRPYVTWSQGWGAAFASWRVWAIVPTDDGFGAEADRLLGFVPGLGPRLGHIRPRNNANRRGLVRDAMTDGSLGTRCLEGLRPGTPQFRARAKIREPSSQGGSHARLELVSMETSPFP